MTPKAILDSIGAMPSAPATREPSRNLRSVSALRASVSIASGTVIRPVFTHRVHYGAPKAPGHRQFIEPKGGGRNA